jgi:hypothetical protein
MRFVCTRTLPYVSVYHPGHSNIAKREQILIDAPSQELAFVKMCVAFPTDCERLAKMGVSPLDYFTVDYEVETKERELDFSHFADDLNDDASELIASEDFV